MPMKLSLCTRLLVLTKATVIGLCLTHLCIPSAVIGESPPIQRAGKSDLNEQRQARNRSQGGVAPRVTVECLEAS